MKYTNIKYLTGILILIFLAALAVAQEDPLGTSNAAAQDIKKTMGEDIFSPGQQDQLGNATPVITGKNLPGSIANSQSSQPKARLLSPTSTWSLNLLDSQERSVALQMYQSNDVVFGKGTIVVGSSLQNATATGTVTGNKLNLDILSDDLTLFCLSLTMNGKSLSGDYHGYSVSYVPWKGIAMGKIN
ncbi:MAG: hypothetical protein M0Q13_12630 [Methanothrix sp.]|jgi:hypothetical protein|nr:hypothetical protein [Methanothrix sp.]